MDSCHKLPKSGTNKSQNIPRKLNYNATNYQIMYLTNIWLSVKYEGIFFIRGKIRVKNCISFSKPTQTLGKIGLRRFKTYTLYFCILVCLFVCNLIKIIIKLQFDQENSAQPQNTSVLRSRRFLMPKG